MHFHTCRQMIVAINPAMKKLKTYNYVFALAFIWSCQSTLQRKNTLLIWFKSIACPQLIVQETTQWKNKQKYIIALIVISETRTHISHHYQENVHFNTSNIHCSSHCREGRISWYIWSLPSRIVLKTVIKYAHCHHRMPENITSPMLHKDKTWWYTPSG